jgi:hypothetical protein
MVGRMFLHTPNLLRFTFSRRQGEHLFQDFPPLFVRRIHNKLPNRSIEDLWINHMGEIGERFE